MVLRQQSHSFLLADDTPAIDLPREPRLRARLARDTASTTYLRRIGSMLGKGARLVRFQDSEKSEWRAMLRRMKHEGAAYSPLPPAWQSEIEAFSGNASPETTFFTYAFLLATTKFSLPERRAIASAAQMADWARHLHSRR